VSVVVPTLGRPHLIPALASVLRQHFQVDVGSPPTRCLEILVIDDSGTSAAADLIQRLQEQGGLPTEGLRVLPTEGRVGAAEARNRGMDAARGAFVAFLDDDDEWLPGHLADALAVLQARPDIDIYASRGLVVDETGCGRVEPVVTVGDRTVAEYFFERASWRSRCRRILTPTLVFRARLRHHRMDPDRTMNEDTWWLLSAERDLGARVVQSPHVGVFVRGSKARTEGRLREDERAWLADVEALRPGGAAAVQFATTARAAVRAGRPGEVWDLGVDVARRPSGWTWVPVVALHLVAAVAVAGMRRGRHAHGPSVPTASGQSGTSA